VGRWGVFERNRRKEGEESLASSRKEATLVANSLAQLGPRLGESPPARTELTNGCQPSLRSLSKKQHGRRLGGARSESGEEVHENSKSQHALLTHGLHREVASKGPRQGT
jgi:hypothetical protein